MMGTGIDQDKNPRVRIGRANAWLPLSKEAKKKVSSIVFPRFGGRPKRPGFDQDETLGNENAPRKSRFSGSFRLLGESRKRRAEMPKRGRKFTCRSGGSNPAGDPIRVDFFWQWLTAKTNLLRGGRVEVEISTETSDSSECGEFETNQRRLLVPPSRLKPGLLERVTPQKEKYKPFSGRNQIRPFFGGAS